MRENACVVRPAQAAAQPIPIPRVPPATLTEEPGTPPMQRTSEASR
jgi:hypothetical protein